MALALMARVRSAIHIVKPETVIAWHRRSFRLFWTWKSRHRTGGPTVSPAVRALIREMSAANPLWGAPRIHGELLKLGITVSEGAHAADGLCLSETMRISGPGFRSEPSPSAALSPRTW